MEVILRQYIPGLGYKYDTVKVKGGYGRNYLIPQGLAIVASTPNRKMIEENIKQAAHKAEKIKQDALDLSLIHISEPTRQLASSRMPSSA